MTEEYVDNPIAVYIKKIMSSNQKKKIIIYGCGSAGTRIFAYLSVMGYETAYFVDMNEVKQGSAFLELPVKSPYDLMYETVPYVVLLSIIDNAVSAGNVLKGIGLVENVDYFDIMHFWGGKKRYDLFDPICGYSRSGDLEGFYVDGNRNSKNAILLLGGSTTDADYSVFTSWGHYFYELIRKKYKDDVVIYNGAISGYESSQELLRFLRDGIQLKPNMVIQFNGVNEVDIDTEHPLVSKYLQYICKTAFDNITDMNVANAPKIGLRSADKLGLSFGVSVNTERHENWLVNMRIMRAICREFGINYYGILQPTSITNDHNDNLIKKINNMQMEHGKEKLEERKNFYENAREACCDHDRIYDFSKIFENVSGSLYFDEVHYTENANKIIAEKIYNLVKKDMKGSKQ